VDRFAVALQEGQHYFESAILEFSHGLGRQKPSKAPGQAR
jgi:hypothetical protein